MFGIRSFIYSLLLGCLCSSVLCACAQELNALQAKGLEIIKGKSAQCVLCHPIPQANVVSGNLAPSLEGVGRRWDEPTLRAKVMDERRFNPQTIMPPYFSLQGLQFVDPLYEGKTILSVSEIDAVVAYLMSLK